MRRVTTRFPIRLPAADCRSEDLLVEPIVPNRPQATHVFVWEAMDNARSSDGNEGVKKNRNLSQLRQTSFADCGTIPKSKITASACGRLRRFGNERGPRSFSIGQKGQGCDRR